MIKYCQELGSPCLDWWKLLHISRDLCHHVKDFCPFSRLGKLDSAHIALNVQDKDLPPHQPTTIQQPHAPRALSKGFAQDILRTPGTRTTEKLRILIPLISQPVVLTIQLLFSKTMYSHQTATIPFHRKISMDITLR